MRRLLLAILCVLPALTTQATLIFGEDIPVTRALPAELRTYAWAPHVASSGDGALAVWIDIRAGIPSVFAARLDANGALLDAANLLVAERASLTDVIWTGQSYLVAWSDGLHIEARTVTPEGALGPARVVVPRNGYYGINTFAMATNGTNVLIATGTWAGALTDLEGNPIATLAFADWSGVQHGVDAVAIGGDYVVALAANGGLLTHHVTSGGVVGAPVRVGASGSPSGALALATDGTRALLVVDALDVYTCMLDSHGEAASPLHAIVDLEQYAVGVPNAVWRGGEYLTSFGVGNGVEQHVQRISRDGDAIGAPSAVFAVGGETDLAVIQGDRGVAVWFDGGPIRSGVFDDASVARPLPFDRVQTITRGATPQLAPSVTNAGGRAVASWSEETPAGIVIRLAAIGGVPVTVALVTDLPEVASRVLFDGETVWVLWPWQQGGVRARRFTATLEPIDAQPLDFALPPESGFDFAALAVAAGDRGVILSDAAHALVLHEESSGVVATVTRLGIDELYEAHDAAAAWNGSEYVAFWVIDLDDTWWQFPQPVRGEVHAVRIARDGTRLDTTPLVISSEPAELSVRELRAARAPNGVAVVWQATTHAKTFGTIFTGNERPPARAIDENVTGVLGPLVAIDGGYLLFRARTDAGLITVRDDRLDADLHPTGETYTLPPFGGVNWADRQYDAVAIGSRPVFVYSRVSLEEQAGLVSRVYARFGAAPGPRRRAVR